MPHYRRKRKKNCQRSLILVFVFGIMYSTLANRAHGANENTFSLQTPMRGTCQLHIYYYIYFNRSFARSLFPILHIFFVWLCVLVLSPPKPPVCCCCFLCCSHVADWLSVCVCRWNFSSLFICFHLHFDLTACHFILFLFSILKHRVPLGWPTKLTVHTRTYEQASERARKERKKW